jgi:hypothetical protein
MSDDFDRIGKPIVPERMISVIVGVDQVANADIGQIPNDVLDFPGGGPVYAGVDDETGVFANDQS